MNRAAILAIAKTVTRDAIGVGGLGLIVFGVGMVCLPAGYIVAGLLMVAVAFLLAKR